MADSDTDYYLQRAEQEAVLAIRAEHPKAAAAHRDLSVRYSAYAVIAIVNDQNEPDDGVRQRGLGVTSRSDQSGD